MRMGRPNKLKSPHLISLMLGEEHRTAIENNVGIEGTSAYIRDCILMRSSLTSDTEEETKAKQEIILKQEKKLKQYEKEEQKQQKVNKEQLAYIIKSYLSWASTTGLNTQHTRSNWASGFTKGLQISPEAALSYLQGEGLFELKK